MNRKEARRIATRLVSDLITQALNAGDWKDDGLSIRWQYSDSEFEKIERELDLIAQRLFERSAALAEKED